MSNENDFNPNSSEGVLLASLHFDENRSKIVKGIIDHASTKEYNGYQCFQIALDNGCYEVDQAILRRADFENFYGQKLLLSILPRHPSEVIAAMDPNACHGSRFLCDHLYTYEDEVLSVILKRASPNRMYGLNCLKAALRFNRHDVLFVILKKYRPSHYSDYLFLAELCNSQTGNDEMVKEFIAKTEPNYSFLVNIYDRYSDDVINVIQKNVPKILDEDISYLNLLYRKGRRKELLNIIEPYVSSSLNCSSFLIKNIHIPEFKNLIISKADPNTVPGSRCLIALIDYDYPVAYEIIMTKANFKDTSGFNCILALCKKAPDKVIPEIIDQVDPNTHNGSIFCKQYLHKPLLLEKVLHCSNPNNQYGADCLLALYKMKDARALDVLINSSDPYSEVGSAVFSSICTIPKVRYHILKNIEPNKNVYSKKIYQSLAEAGNTKARLIIADPNTETGYRYLRDLSKKGYSEAEDIILMLADINTEYGAKSLRILIEKGDPYAIDIVNNSNSYSKFVLELLQYLSSTGRISVKGRQQMKEIEKLNKLKSHYSSSDAHIQYED